jgi:hypothetical protein
VDPAGNSAASSPVSPHYIRVSFYSEHTSFSLPSKRQPFRMLDQPPVREHPPFFGMPISSCKCSGLLFRSFPLSPSPIFLSLIDFVLSQPPPISFLPTLFAAYMACIRPSSSTKHAQSRQPWHQQPRSSRSGVCASISRSSEQQHRRTRHLCLTRLRKSWTPPISVLSALPPTLADSTSGSAQPVFLAGHHAVQSEGRDGEPVRALRFRQRTSGRGFPVFLPSVVMALRFSRGQVGASPSSNHHPEPS